MILSSLVLALLVEAHPLIQLVPDSVVAEEERNDDGEMTVVYREDNRRTRRGVRGTYWSFDYRLPDEVTRDDIVEHFRSESERLHAWIHRDTGNRLTFSILRQDGGETWCQLWATDGNYTLEIVDESPSVNASFDDAPRPSATIVFERGEAELDREAERVVARIADWLEDHPAVLAEVRGQRGPLEDPALPGERAKAVAAALLARGIAEERLTVTEQDLSDAGFEVTVLAIEP